MTLDPLLKGVMQVALVGLENQSVDADYAASLLPEPWQTAWKKQRAALDAYYRGYRYWRMSLDEATPAVKRYHSETLHFIEVQDALVAKGAFSDKRLLVENQNSNRLQMDFRALTDAEKEWFVPLDRTDRWRDLPPKLRAHFQKLQPIHVAIQEADRLAPFADKLTDTARQFLFNAITRSDVHAGLD